jgi:ankyrin repeat protein
MNRVLVVLFFVYVAPSFGMDAPLGSKRPRPQEPSALMPELKQSRVEKSSVLELVPEGEQREKLKKYMATAPGFGMEKLYNVGRNIRNLRLVSKVDRDWIDAPKHMDELIRSLANQYTNNNRTQVILALGAKPAFEWLRNKLEEENTQNPGGLAQYRHLEKEVSKELINQLIRGHTDAARALIITAKSQDGAKDFLDYQTQDPDGNTILNAAAKAGDEKIFNEVLPLNFAKINEPNKHGITPLLNAINGSHTSIAIQLLKARAMPLVVENGQIVDSALLHAAEINNTEIIKELLKNEDVRRHVNLTTDWHPFKPLTSAARDNNYESFKLLFAVPGVEVEGEVIYWAIAQNQNMLADLLARKDIDFNQESPTERGHEAYPAFGLFAAQSEKGQPLLDDNTARDRLMLIAPRIKLNLQDELGKTLLMMAVEQAKAKTVEKLLELGADVMLADKKGKTALDYAQELKTDNKERIIKLLQAAANRQMKK